MECVVSSPEEYYSVRMAAFIQSECRLPRNQWIYRIIDNNLKHTDERVFLDDPAWCLCLDKHCGDDVRYLVVFKDTALKTIRDLRREHVPMLAEVEARVRAWLREQGQHGDEAHFALYFHYMPSVFQLHLHVREHGACRRHIRIQPLAVVCENLEACSTHYKDALILSKYCKTLQRAETHTKLALGL